MHVLWKCPAYSSSRLIFLEKLQGMLGDRYTEFTAGYASVHMNPGEMNRSTQLGFFITSNTWNFECCLHHTI